MKIFEKLISFGAYAFLGFFALMMLSAVSGINLIGAIFSLEFVGDAMYGILALVPFALIFGLASMFFGGFRK